jgi:hypothetical protein
MACGVEYVFYPNARAMVSYARTIYCIEILITCFIYMLIAKEIRTLVNTTDNSSSQQTEATEVSVPPSSNEATCPEHTFRTDQGTSTKVVAFDENFEAGSSNQGLPSTTLKSLPMVRGERGQIPKNRTKIKAGLQWKFRAFKMVTYTILSTIIPSVPMVVTQIVGYIKPDLLNETVDVVISLCNVFHAILFPIMFLVTVKQ